MTEGDKDKDNRISFDEFVSVSYLSSFFFFLTQLISYAEMLSCVIAIVIQQMFNIIWSLCRFVLAEKDDFIVISPWLAESADAFN